MWNAELPEVSLANALRRSQDKQPWAPTEYTRVGVHTAMLPHYPPDAMRHHRLHGRVTPMGNGRGDTVHSTLTCRCHALSHVATDAQRLDRLEHLDARLHT